MYAKTATWTFTSGASATLTFYGTKVWLYAAKAFDQAIRSLSLDGSTAATIDNYSATRDAAALAWDSPLLTLGTHTLTITNTGTNNAASAGYNIAIDRADVATSSADVQRHLTLAVCNRPRKRLTGSRCADATVRSSHIPIVTRDLLKLHNPRRSCALQLRRSLLMPSFSKRPPLSLY
jgi:hypothetical protein